MKRAQWKRLIILSACLAAVLSVAVWIVWGNTALVRTPALWCRHSAGHGALIPALWCTLSAEDGAPVPFPVVHDGRRRWCTAAMLGLYL